MNPYIYTTQDEITFIRGLEKRGQRSTLRNYRRAFAYRDFSGTDVDKSEVERELSRILGKESGREDVDKFNDISAGLVKEWLGGGKLRKIVMENAVREEGWK